MEKVFGSEMTQRLARVGMEVLGLAGQLEADSRGAPLQGKLEFLLAGAAAVQVGTPLVRHGPELFAHLEICLAQLLAGLGFPTAAAATGQMRDRPA